MPEADYCAEFRDIRKSDHGDPHSLGNDRLQVLWVLSVTTDHDALAYLTPAQASDILRDVEGIHVSRQRATGILAAEKGTVSRKRVKGKSAFRIMKAGIDAISQPNFSAMFVDPEKALTEIRRMEEVLAKFKGTLKICDPYIDNKTLDFLAECTAATELRLLSHNIYGDSKVRRDLAALRKQMPIPIEVRTAPSGLLHDRYIIHRDGMLLLGTSLNGFAKKQSFVVQLGPDIRASIDKAFDATWAKSTTF